MLGSGLSAARELAPDEVPSVLPIPYVVGPELFRVYTDARLFRVRIIINGHPGHVANDGGDGAWRDDEIGVDVVGPLGYPNLLNINGFLVPGKNQIVVEFSPNPELAKYQGSPDVMAKIAATMFTRVIVTRGVLREDFGGIDEDELPEALAQNAKSKAAKILYNTRKKVAPRDVLSPVRHEFSFQLTQADKIDRVKFEECKLRARRDPDTLTAKAYVNGVLLSTMENDYSSDKDGHNKAFRPGANAITLEVEALQAPSRVAFRLDCDLEEAKKRSGLGKKYGRFSVGDLHDQVSFPVAEVKVDGPGSFGALLELPRDNVPSRVGADR
jgi:hypothetical protein